MNSQAGLPVVSYRTRPGLCQSFTSAANLRHLRRSAGRRRAALVPLSRIIHLRPLADRDATSTCGVGRAEKNASGRNTRPMAVLGSAGAPPLYQMSRQPGQYAPLADDARCCVAITTGTATPKPARMPSGQHQDRGSPHFSERSVQRAVQTPPPAPLAIP